ncbi:MAG: AMP-binding protein [Propionibacteriaceae bacterium]|jgi:acyl-CoA synthetase (AMP-forming)/AMP-acid ligase II|nr:AMP-binding protein [Propionibacteriaceae bacterium]
MSVIGAISANVESVAPLTDPQADLLEGWSAGRRSSGVWQQCVRWHGPFDPARVAQAARLVAVRHEVLRTVVVHRPPAAPRQAILRRRPPELRPLDLSQFDPARAEAELAAVRQNGLSRGFDPATDPLSRIDLVQLPGPSAALVWTSHRLIVDPSAFARLWHDFCDYHERLRLGQAASSIETEARWRARASTGFHDWVRRRQAEPDGLAHWSALTAGLPGPARPAALEKDRSARAGGPIRRRLDSQLADRLISLAHDCQTDLEQVAQAAWGIVLQRQVGRPDVAFGRLQPVRIDAVGYDRLVGAMDQVRPVRVTSQPGDKVADCLARLTAQAAAAGSLRCRLTEVGRRCGLGDDLAASWISFEPDEAPAAPDYPLDGVALEWEPPRQQWPAGWAVGWDSRPDQLSLTAQAQPEAGSEADAGRVLVAWEQALIGLAQGPDGLVDAIDAAGPAELERVRLDFNSAWSPPVWARPDPDESPARPGPAADLGLAWSMSVRAAQDPLALALISQRRQVNRGELERAAAAVVQRLLQAGVGPGDRVVVLARRGPELVAVLLGLARLGAVSLAIDPDQSDRRRNAWLTQLRPAAVVLVGLERSLPAGLATVQIGSRIWTTRPDQPGWPTLGPAAVAADGSSDVRLLVPSAGAGDSSGPIPAAGADDLPSAGPERPAGPPPASGPAVPPHPSADAPLHGVVGPDRAGDPQGLLVSNRTVVNYALNPALDGLFDHDQARLLSVCDHSAGLFAAELWPALLRGRPVILADESELAEPARFAQIAQDGAATVLLSTAAGLAGLTSHPGALAGLRRLRRLALAGPPCPADLPRRLREHSDAAWLSLYAPAQTALWGALGQLDWERPGLVGRPLGGCQIHIVERDRLCAVGQIGQVCLAGAAVPLGGLGLDQEEAEPITDNPFGPGRLYHCGERGRWLPDGRLELCPADG